MKSYTDIEQSKKLAEFLPLESADMHYLTYSMYEEYCDEIVYTANLGKPGMYDKCCIPCWSLAALLNILPSSTLDSSNDHYYRLHCLGKFTKWHDNQIDTCYEMILILKENNLI